MYDRRPGFFREDTPPVPGHRVDATVKWFNVSKGFGFVTLSDGKQDAFLALVAFYQTFRGTMYDRRPGFFREDTPPVPGRRVDATVKWFNASKGFGFVTLSDGTQDAFLPMAILRRAGFDDVREGSLIT